MHEMIDRYYELLAEEKMLKQQIRKHLLQFGVRKLEAGVLYCLNWALNKSSDSFALKTYDLQAELDGFRFKLAEVQTQINDLENGTESTTVSPCPADKISLSDCSTPPKPQTTSPKRPKSPEMELGKDMGRLFAEVKDLDLEARFKALEKQYPGKSLEEIDEALALENKREAAGKFERKQAVLEKANTALKR